MSLYLPMPEHLHAAALAAAEFDVEHGYDQMNEAFPGFVDETNQYLNELLTYQKRTNCLRPLSPHMPSGYLDIMAPFVLFSTDTIMNAAPVPKDKPASVSIKSIVMGIPFENFSNEEMAERGARRAGTWLYGDATYQDGEKIEVYYPLPEALPFLPNCVLAGLN